MTSGTCPHCGGPVATGATACPWCGAGLPVPPPPPSEPTYSYTPRPFTDDGLTDLDAVESWPRARLWAAGVAIAIVLLVSVIYLSGAAAPQTISVPPTGPAPEDTVFVNHVAISAPPTACGLNGITPGAFSTQPDGLYVWGWWLPLSGPTPCSVTGVSTNTSGFSLSGNFPVNVSAGQSSIPLLVNIDTPSAFNGTLYVQFE